MKELIEQIKATWLGRVIIGRMDELTTWIGVLGFCLEPILPSSWMMFLFVALIFLPDGKFSDIFGEWTKKIREEKE